MKTRLLMWRWRSNPLRRRSDVLEAWIVLAAALFAVVAGGSAGIAAGSGVHDYLLAQAKDRRQVGAVLVGDPETSRPGADEVHRSRERATVRWTAADGSEVTATARVPRGLREGDRARVWTDTARQRIATPPPGAFDAGLQGVLAGVSSAAVIVALAWLARRVAGVRLDRARLRTWECEWARVGPEWRRKRGTW
ncbi:hypothetical protein SRB5_22290 [Streptomyces sp. RB5]|uniref:Integral membrane protein n=1 Tax=Streptomyces smaragdinus TaxID=2585196 RepID=A0A7K0CF52_9ACTN|nr:hypothetical protein [Streptomyces smaragdinus]MQY12099.1 hypothetical protein [Streptomyces smaragdinus]